MEPTPTANSRTSGYNTYNVTDESGVPCPLSANSAQEAAETFVAEGDWPEITETMWHDLSVAWVDRRGCLHREDVCITREPVEPKCPGRDEHEWSVDVVRGSGGGVVCAETCEHCDLIRVTDTWATNPATGVQGLDSIEYVVFDDV